MKSEALKIGRVFLIGAGPGDPELLTLKAARAISASDVLVYDHLVNPEILAHARRGVELVYSGKRAGITSISQNRINSLLIHRARMGRVVGRLKGGDPFVFGRGGEEAAALASAGIPWEVIPGISAGIAVPAYAGIPLTHRNHASSTMFVTGHGAGLRSVDWSAIARAADTLVIFMCGDTIAEIATQLILNGRPESSPIALVRWGTYSCQEVFVGTIGDLEMLIRHRPEARPRFDSPVIAIVGEVVRLQENLHWFGAKPNQLAASEQTV